MPDSLVSIIIPAYNAAKYVEGAVDSALGQTYKDIEIIVVDDGSTDNIREILEPYIAAKKIKYIYQENRGLAGARNTGIKISKGKYIALLDADDIFLSKKIEKQVIYLENHPECDICYCNLYHFWDGEPGKLFKLNYRYYSGGEVLPNLIKKDFIAPLTMLIRRSVFERFGVFDENFRRSEDLEFLVRILTGGAKIFFLDEPLAKLRLRRADNLQGFESQPEVKLTGLKIFEDLYKRSTRQECKRLKLEKYLPLYRLKVGLAYFENKNKKEAANFIKNAFREWSGGELLGLLLWSAILLVPSNLLSRVIQYYHLRKQESLLKKI